MGRVDDDFETLYRAMESRDQRFDGRFVVAVTSTGVYCRPVCPSRTPLRANVRFFRLPAGAETAGFRACRRCRPDAQPSAAEWSTRGDVTARALRLIADGTVDREGVHGLARRLAVSERHLHRLLVAEVGVGPQPLAISRRAQTARLLVEQSDLPLADVAFAAGYASVRTFNEGMRAAFGCPPGDLRRTAGPRADDEGHLALRLRHRLPMEAGRLLRWLADRALPGVETAGDARYARTLRLPHGPGEMTVGFPPGREAVAEVGLTLSDLRDVAVAVRCCRDIFDLDADPVLVGDVLHADPVLAGFRSGLRVPGYVDGFEVAVREVLGPGSPAASRLVALFGTPYKGVERRLTHLFPSPEALADADLASAGVGPRRAATLRALAQAVTGGRLALGRGGDRDETVALLGGIAGIGPNLAGRVAMHGLGDPDVCPSHDRALVAVAHAAGLHHDVDLAGHARRWRPWRSYAAMQLLRPSSPAFARA
jgi:AraC family transcriptional regulator of adaptative response / DNA-3-methyladenine glycosylase II